MNKKMQMSRHKLDLLEYYIAKNVNMNNLNNKEKTEKEDKIYIEGLRKELGLSIKNIKAKKWNR